MGGAIGAICVRTARHYDHLVRSGCDPDGSSLIRAVFASVTASARPIIGSDATGWLRLLPIMAGVLSAGILAGLYLRLGISAWFVALGAASVLLVLLACIDARTCLLPDALTQPLLWLGIACAWAGIGLSMTTSIAGILLGYALLAIPRVLWLWWQGIDGMGRGDIKLLAALGAWVGDHGIMMVLAVACITGLVFAVVRQRRWGSKGGYPFGPFIVLGAMTEFLFPTGVQSWF